MRANTCRARISHEIIGFNKGEEHYLVDRQNWRQIVCKRSGSIVSLKRTGRYYRKTLPSEDLVCLFIDLEFAQAACSQKALAAAQLELEQQARRVAEQ
jgi:hypothetical protein